MFDQSLSAENFRMIFDYANRKGINLEDDFFHDVRTITRRIKRITGYIKKFKRSKSSMKHDIYQFKMEKLNHIKSVLKQKKEEKLTQEMITLSEKARGKINISLRIVDTKKGKPAYVNEGGAEEYFALKQVQYNLKKLYKIKQSNRYSTVCQLREALKNKIPKCVIKTDISSFYESVPRASLIEKLNNDNLLAPTSKKLIRRVLDEYGQISGQSMGLPRGIGISAYLAEVYMRQFDIKIRELDSVHYYARYVDDIIIVCTPESTSNLKTFQETTVNAIRSIASGLYLTVNEQKTIAYEINGSEEVEIEYLGYNFKFGKGNVKLTLSESKLEKIRKRIQLSIESYENNAQRNEKVARKIFMKRIKYLTGNTRLVNHKKNVAVGIYFTNSLISDAGCLSSLDEFLAKILQDRLPKALSEKANQYCFRRGFEEKRFHKFSADELKDIVKVWKNVH